MNADIIETKGLDKVAPGVWMTSDDTKALKVLTPLGVIGAFEKTPGRPMTSVVVLHNNIHWVVGSFFHGQTPDSENGYALLVAEMTKFNQQGIEEIIRRLFKNDVLPSIKIVNRYPNMGSN